MLLRRINGAEIEKANSALLKIFVGPDTIFTGNVALLNANIFGIEKEGTIQSVLDAINALPLAEAGTEIVAPRNNDDSRNKRNCGDYICCFEKYMCFNYVSRAYFYRHKNSFKFS